MPNRNCKICLSEFYASPSHLKQGWGKYCSLACAAKAKTGKGNHRYKDEGWVLCKSCGARFKQKPSAVKHSKAKVFCSRECFNKEHGRVAGECKECGALFEYYRKDRSVFCSKECVSKSSDKKISRFCVQCGTEFRIKRSAPRHGKSAGSFCNNRCKYMRMSKTQLSVGGKDRNPKGGKRDDLGGLYVRSRWEANYARYLNFLKANGAIKNWEYEADTFEFEGIKRGVRFYTPDFKVYELSGEISYHEVKGWMDKRSVTRHKRMEKYHPNVKVVMIMKKEMLGIHKSVGGLINWELGSKKNPV